MAKELPEYKRNVVTTPSAAPVGFATAFDQVGAAAQSFGSFGAQVASDVAHERARLAGQEMGKEPGKDVSFAISSVDKSFKQAYVEESTKVLQNNGYQYLNSALSDFAKNPMPTGQDLQEYQQSATQVLDEYLKLADPSIAKDLQRSFEQQFSSDYLKLAERVSKADNQRLMQTFNASTSANLASMFNNAAVGNLEAVEQNYQDQLKNLTSARVGLGEDKFIEGMTAAKLARDTSIAQSEMREASRKDGQKGAIKYIQNFSEKGKPGLTEAEKISITDNLYNTFIKEQKVNKLNNNVDYSDALVEMAQSPNGYLGVDRMQHYEQRLEHTTYNDLLIKNLDAQRKATANNEVAAYMGKNSNNSVALSDLTGKQLDAGFAEAARQMEAKRGAPLQLEDMAQLANVYDVAIPSFNKQLSSGINSRDPDLALKTADTYIALKAENLNAVDKVNKSDDLKAQMLHNLGLNGADAKDAWEHVNKQTNNLTQSQLEDREKFFKQQMKPMNDFDVARKSVARELGYKLDLLPPGAVTDYQNALKFNYMQTGDMDISKADAAEVTKRLYPETTINGYKEVQRLAPPAGLRPFILDETKKLFDLQSQMFNDKQGVSLFRYEIPADEEVIRRKAGVGIGLILDVDKRNPTPVVQIDPAGNKVKGTLYVTSDNLTEFPEDGQSFSYPVMFLPDGKYNPRPIMDPKTNSQFRFNLTAEMNEKIKKEDKEYQLALERRAKAWQEQKDKIATLRDELDEEIGISPP
jgi:hypothetical protein